MFNLDAELVASPAPQRSSPHPDRAAKVALVQYEDRDDRLLLELVALNARYCERWGYEHVFIRRVSADIPPWWVKCFVLLEVLKKGYDIVAWLDSDAVVHDQERSVDSVFVGPESMVHSSDPPAWANPSVFNAGVLFFRGTADAVSLMEQWCASLDLSRWRKEDGQWMTDGPWAGADYEQGAFVSRVMPMWAMRGVIATRPWQELQSPWVTAQSYCLHFANYSRPNAGFYLNLLDRFRLSGGVELLPR